MFEQPEWCDGSLDACLRCHLTDECVVGVLYAEIRLEDALDRDISGDCGGGHSSPEYMREWRAKNAEKVKAYFRKYASEHREYLAVYMARWWSENRDRKKAYDREYYRRHKAERAEHDKQAYAENRETILARNRAYYEAHKEEINARKREKRKLKNHNLHEKS